MNKKLILSDFKAFTLAEVLIALLVIGIVASIVIPTIINEFEKQALAAQTKSAVAIFQAALKQATYNNGIPFKCSLYKDGSVQPYSCTYNTTSKIYVCTLGDGSAEPSTNRWTGLECGQLFTALKGALNIIKTCSAGQGVAQGCMPAYKSKEDILKLNNSMISDASITQDVAGCGTWSRNSFNTSISSFVLNNGMIVFYSSPQFPAIDINGKKGPNKWGYDVFTLTFWGSKQNGYTTNVLPDLRCIYAEPGGSNPTTLMKNY